MTKTGIIASSPSKDRLQKMINEYFYSTAWVILEDLRLFNNKQKRFCTKYLVENKRGRYYFKMKGE
jgi:hypothetical protein